VGSDAHGRAPGAGAGGSVDEQVAEAFQAVREFAENTGGEPGKGENLPAMGVSGKLQANSLLFHDGEAVRDVSEENTGARGIELGVFENRLEAARVGRIVIRDAEDLEAVEIDGFVVENVDARIANGVEIVGGIGEFFVIASNEIGAETRRERFPGSSEADVVGVRAVEHIAGDEDDVGAKLAECGDEPAEKAATDDVAEVRVGDKGGGAPTPGGGEAGKFNGDAIDADGGGVEDAVEAGEESKREESGGDLRASDREMEELDERKSEPGRDGGKERKIQDAQPSGSEAVKDADRLVEIAMSQKRARDERDRKEEESDGERGRGNAVVAREEVGEGLVDEGVENEEEELDDRDEAGDSGEAERLRLGYGRFGGGHTVVGCGRGRSGEMGRRESVTKWRWAEETTLSQKTRSRQAFRKIDIREPASFLSGGPFVLLVTPFAVDSYFRIHSCHLIYN
jgi:hypothetical protein